MNLTIKIAWRNIWRHKGKSMVIGSILFIGALLMTLGNGIISGMEKGLKENISKTFTGDIVISSSRELTDDVLLRQMGTPLEVIEDFDTLDEALEKSKYVKDYLPITIGFASVLNLGPGTFFAGIIGVDIEQYMNFFPNSIEMVEGRNLKPGEKGMIVATQHREEMLIVSDYWYVSKEEGLVEANLNDEAKLFQELDTKDELVLMGMSKDNAALDVKVPIRGVFRFKSLNKYWGNYNLIDINSYREANNMVTGGKEVVLTDEENELFEEEFSLGDDFLSDLDDDAQAISFDDFSSEVTKEFQEDIVSREKVDNGAYQAVLVKLKDGISDTKAIHELNELFRKKDIDAKALTWKASIGILGNMALFFKIALNVFILFIFFVAIIIIMNTLSMAAMERVTELGMMRAIGAKKSFLQGMFTAETCFLSLFFGGLGILGGMALLLFIKNLGLTTENEFLQLIYGGDILNPVISFRDFLIGVFELFIVSLLAVLYPLRLVKRIKPLDALGRD